MRWAWIATLLLASCATRRAETRAARPDPLVERADLAWEARATDGFDPVETTLVEGLHRREERGRQTWELLWRLARLRVAQGVTETTDRAAMDRYAEARALAMRCLESAPAFKQRRVESGLTAALPFIPDERLPCATWAALSWSRWIAVLGGEAAALDIEAVDALADYSAKAGDSDARVHALWSGALLAASRPAWAGGEPETARAELERVQRLLPEDWIVRYDLALLVGVAQDDRALVDSLSDAARGAAASQPEQDAARDKLAALGTRAAPSE